MKMPSCIAGFCQINWWKKAKKGNVSDQSLLTETENESLNKYDRIKSAVLKLIVRKLEKISRGIQFILTDTTNLG